MKIDNSSKTITGGTLRDEPGRPLRKSADDTAGSAQSTTVKLSPLSAQLQDIQRGFAETPVVDAARVAELKDAISSGHFKVDADKIADRLLKTVEDLIAARRAQ